MTVDTAGDVDADGEALDIPFPRSRQRLVEIVDVEDEISFGRGEDAEVLQVTIAASLDVDARIGGEGAQIVRHEARDAAQEGKRRSRHARVSHRDQVRKPPHIRRFEDGDRVRPPAARPPIAVRASPEFGAQRLSLRDQTCDGTRSRSGSVNVHAEGLPSWQAGYSCVSVSTGFAKASPCASESPSGPLTSVGLVLGRVNTKSAFDVLKFMTANTP